LGVSNYILKPVDLRDAVSKVEKIVNVIYNQRALEEKNKELIEQTQRALALEKVKSDFLANMSHEVRTPLNAIIGFTSLMNVDMSKAQLEKFLKIIEKSSKHLSELVEDILDYSKIESGTLKLHPVDFNIKYELDFVISLFQTQAEKKDIKILITYTENLPEVVEADVVKIKQVFMNLLSNAIKFSNTSQTVKIEVDFTNNLLGIKVIDEGIGIKEKKLNKIFEVFDQEDNSSTRKYGGIGLGLSICNGLVTLMGGHINLKSDKGIGSEFHAFVPVNVISNKKDIKQEVMLEDDIKFPDKKVLVVEDNKTNQLFLEAFLQSCKCDYDIAATGEKALDFYKNNSYDLILMDINLPDISGVTVTENIIMYEKEHNLIHIPIIAQTSNTLDEDIKKYLSVGMDYYLSKPISIKKLKNLFNILLC
jgi:CheY-like chemotaxis protein